MMTVPLNCEGTSAVPDEIGAKLLPPCSKALNTNSCPFKAAFTRDPPDIVIGAVGSAMNRAQ
jgi:hypothetical protein